ncbi:MAG: DUF5686 and carboxypeptidase regulatory-like domain-containing protein [Bacteroidales bacterium]|nr:DUF5686 and carboxypeptidase regulatory-like domain-containing protein [Bacteroidales bacterium]
MRYVNLFVFINLFCFTLNAQNYSISGKVIDTDSRSSLPFVNIVINDSRFGGTSDIDGKFSFESSKKIEFLTLSYVGYETLVYPIGNKTDKLVIRLKQTEYELPEYVVLPGINPAHRIIENAITNRDINDPEKLPSFSYTSYDKVIFSLELDSLPMSMDTITVDTSDFMLRKYLEEHHIFIMETVSERKFMSPDRNNEKIIATKVAGFKNPIFIFLLSQLQSTSFYKERITIADKNYINPVSKGSTKKYFFLLQDTVYTERGDSVFIISYRPLKNTNFDGLKGVISINSHNWAIQNVRAEPAGIEKGISMRIEQMYELLEGYQWFPVQLNTEIILNNISIHDSSIILSSGGGEDTNSSADSTVSANDSLSKKGINMPFGKGKSYIKNINLNPGFRQRDFNYLAVDVDPDASQRDDIFWKGYRIDSLTSKEEETYKFIDSISKEAHLERMAQTLETLLTGKIPWGYFDLDLNRFLRYNSYEGLALGLGLHTNRRLSEAFTLGGFARYGFKDKKIKYGGDINLILHRNSDLNLRMIYLNGVTETGGVSFFDDARGFIRPDMYRDMFVNRMDNTEMYKASAGFRTLKWMKMNIGITKSYKEVTNNYKYGISNENVKVYFNSFDFTEVNVGFRYAYNEKYIRNMKKKISLGTDYPIIWFQYTRGIKGFLDGDFDYNRYDLKIEKSFYTNYIGKSTFKMAAGYVDENIPYTNLYNGNASYRTFTLYAPNSFGTMRMNEFLSNKYLALYFTHDFGKLLVRNERFHPEFAFVTNIGFGWLDYNNNHYNIDYKTMEKGYYESGLLINKILVTQLSSLGLGILYRYGPYTFPYALDNIGGKITISFLF